MARDFCERLTRDGTRYADLIFNPTHWSAWHRRLPAMLDALDAGLHEAEQDGPPTLGLCVSLLRTQSADQALELVEELIEMRHPRMVALPVDGNEAAAGRTGPRFAQSFLRAGEAHPVDRLRRAGVAVSLNTDDPSLLGTWLPRE